ncbi:MAG: AIM24 family protein [Dactylosporangium sp.]|nr:AIM24 family protein [Dactylosporangium sp.]NNJ59632.1 AIM24 family protein [Dactylosporangium sp.]
MHSDIFNAESTAQPPAQPGIHLQHSRCVKHTVSGEAIARQGTMVAYRGNLQFEVKGQGVGNLLKRAVTGEGLALMSVRGQGEVWFADQANNCFLIDLSENDALSINGRNVLCFDSTLRYDIQMVRGAGMFAGGLFNSVFTGTGRLAISCDGQPIIIPVTPQAPVFVDTDAVVGWSATLQTSIHKSQSLRSMLRGGSGELFQLALHGQGFVIVQPSEGVKPAAAR